MDMQDRTVVVTGGASGIGKATAFLLAREGARVLIGDVDEPGGRAAVVEGAAVVSFTRPPLGQHTRSRRIEPATPGLSGDAPAALRETTADLSSRLMPH